MDRHEKQQKKERDWLQDRYDLAGESKVGIWTAIFVFVIVAIGTMIGKK